MSECADWLSQQGYGDWKRLPLAGDASNRRYERLARGSDRVILMIDPDRQNMERFTEMTGCLRAAGLCAPKVIAAQTPKGLALLEDLGPHSLRAHLDHHPEQEAEIYAALPDLLAAIARMDMPEGLEILDAARGADMIAPLESYVPGIELTPLKQALHRVLETYQPSAPVLSLRDFHADNLIWRPHLSGNDRFGLLDYQDAVAGHPAYDLASLLSDCRRDVSAGIADALLRRMAVLTGHDQEWLWASVTAWSVQRNLRILGIFARLGTAGKTTYRALMPRVWGHLQRDLSHPALTDVRDAAQSIPAPEGSE